MRLSRGSSRSADARDKLLQAFPSAHLRKAQPCELMLHDDAGATAPTRPSCPALMHTTVESTQGPGHQPCTTPAAPAELLPRLRSRAQQRARHPYTMG